MKQKITCARVAAPRVPNCFYELIKMSQMQAPEGKLFIVRQVIQGTRISQKAVDKSSVVPGYLKKRWDMNHG